MSSLLVNRMSAVSERLAEGERKEAPAPFSACFPRRHVIKPAKAEVRETSLPTQQSTKNPPAAQMRTACKLKKPRHEETGAKSDGAIQEQVFLPPPQAGSNLMGNYGGVTTGPYAGMDLGDTLREILSGKLPGAEYGVGQAWTDGRQPYDDGLDATESGPVLLDKASVENAWDNNCSACEAHSSFDFEPLMDQLIPIAGDNGIFELVLPDGGTMGVVVDLQPQLLSFLLKPSDPGLTLVLQPQQMELKARLEQRIRKNVKVTVL